jgi:hypothetical protein
MKEYEFTSSGRMFANIVTPHPAAPKQPDVAGRPPDKILIDAAPRGAAAEFRLAR